MTLNQNYINNKILKKIKLNIIELIIKANPRREKNNKNRLQ